MLQYDSMDSRSCKPDEHLGKGIHSALTETSLLIEATLGLAGGNRSFRKPAPETNEMRMN